MANVLVLKKIKFATNPVIDTEMHGYYLAQKHSARKQGIRKRTSTEVVISYHHSFVSVEFRKPSVA